MNNLFKKRRDSLDSYSLSNSSEEDFSQIDASKDSHGFLIKNEEIQDNDKVFGSLIDPVNNTHNESHNVISDYVQDSRNNSLKGEQNLKLDMEKNSIDLQINKGNRQDKMKESFVISGAINKLNESRRSTKSVNFSSSPNRSKDSRGSLRERTKKKHGTSKFSAFRNQQNKTGIELMDSNTEQVEKGNSKIKKQKEIEEELKKMKRKNNFLRNRYEKLTGERNEKKEVLEKLKRRLERLKKKVNLTNKDIEQSIVEFEKEVLKNSDINIRRESPTKQAQEKIDYSKGKEQVLSIKERLRLLRQRVKSIRSH